MSDLGFIVAGYGVILGGLAVYTGLLLRRLAAARRELPELEASGPHEEPTAADSADAHRG